MRRGVLRSKQVAAMVSILLFASAVRCWLPDPKAGTSKVLTQDTACMLLTSTTRSTHALRCAFRRLARSRSEGGTGRRRWRPTVMTASLGRPILWLQRLGVSRRQHQLPEQQQRDRVGLQQPRAWARRGSSQGTAAMTTSTPEAATVHMTLVTMRGPATARGSTSAPPQSCGRQRTAAGSTTL